MSIYEPFLDQGDIKSVPFGAMLYHTFHSVSRACGNSAFRGVENQLR